MPMRIKNRSNNSKNIVIIVLVLLIIAVCSVTYFVFIRNKNIPNENQSESSQLDNENGNEKNETPIQNESTNNPTAGTDETIDGYFTHKSISNDTLVLRVLIGELLSGGSCSLKIINGERAVTRQAPTINSATTASCEGFDIPVSELSSGLWTIQIEITANNRLGTITDEIRI